ncbi:MAG: hypothetical protein KBS81_00220, partial [Spirochaetales bacterium]|nr:hypothetical protein [Candidatus Physcosoma equi]
MAERKTFSRYNMRCGMVLYAQEGNLKLDGFELPELDSRFFVLTAKDIPGENAVRIMGAEVPLLADEYIDYAGQPLLVLFGPDYETTELALEKIKVKAHQEKRESDDEENFPDQMFFSWGLDDTEESDNEKKKLKKTETSFEISHSPVPSPVRYSILSWTDASGNNLHVSTPTQWPTLVKDTVSAATASNPSSIILHTEKYNAKNDEFFINPAIYAAFT